jgi:hypothetical protein
MRFAAGRASATPYSAILKSPGEPLPTPSEKGRCKGKLGSEDAPAAETRLLKEGESG